MNYQKFTSWKLNVVENGTLVTKAYTNIKWEYANIKPNVSNQVVKLKVFDEANNIVGIYYVNIKFI